MGCLYFQSLTVCCLEASNEIIVTNSVALNTTCLRNVLFQSLFLAKALDINRDNSGLNLACANGASQKFACAIFKDPVPFYNRSQIIA